MTYFGFLALFLVIPIGALLALALWDRSRGKELPPALRGWPPAAAILLHVVIALAYTTVWDNYLVATRVWWYDPALVTGLTIAYVPIEEYTFFVLQPVLAGLWLLFLMRRLRAPSEPAADRQGLWLRAGSVAVLAPIWLGSVIILASGWQAGTYMGLELVWALPPIALQLAFGADILWRHRRLVALVIVPLTLYLSAADALAIDGGIWTINPVKSVDLLLGGILPVEEFLFFLLTNTLVTFGVTLVMAEESHERIRLLRDRVRARQTARSRRSLGDTGS